MTPHEIYQASDGEATKQLYARLTKLGPVGIVALNLFRAQKCSARAKVYRGGIPGQGSYKDMAYERKQWAMTNLAAMLAQHAGDLGITWGWKIDPSQSYHRWVLYVDTPAGQVSFHTAARGHGPDYESDWDGVRDVCANRICNWCERLLEDQACHSTK